MPVYEVISGELDGTNGNSPKKKNVRASTPIKAAWHAHVIGGGKKLVKVNLVGYNEEDKWWIYQAVNDRHVSFSVHVQELHWLERWSKLFKVT